MTRSERLRRRIVWLLRHEWRAEGGSSWKSFAALAERLGAPLRSVKREVRRMARDGRLHYSSLWNEDGICGGGYILSHRWEGHQEGRPEDPCYEEFPEDVVLLESGWEVS